MSSADLVHEITEDSYGEALPSPLRVRVEAHPDGIALTVLGEGGEHTLQVHLEVDAAAGGAVALRVWRGGNEPFLALGTPLPPIPGEKLGGGESEAQLHRKAATLRG